MEVTHSGRTAKLSAIVAMFHNVLPLEESLSPLGQVKDKTPNKGRQIMIKDGEGGGHGAEPTQTFKHNDHIL